jgi:hypothetical protein
MLAHWNLKAALRGQPPPISSSQIEQILGVMGERQRDLGRAENEVCGAWKGPAVLDLLCKPQPALFLDRQSRTPPLPSLQTTSQTDATADPPSRQIYKYFAAEFMRQNLSETFEATVLGPFRAESNLSAIIFDDLGLETLTKVPWSVKPGERVAVSPTEADPPSGFYRLSVIGELESAVKAARLAAEEVAERERGGGSDGDEIPDMNAVWEMVENGERGSDGDLDGEEEDGGGGRGRGGKGSGDGGLEGQGAAAASAAAVVFLVADAALRVLSGVVC